jgi:hypothetical protein
MGLNRKAADAAEKRFVDVTWGRRDRVDFQPPNTL